MEEVCTVPICGPSQPGALEADLETMMEIVPVRLGRVDMGEWREGNHPPASPTVSRVFLCSLGSHKPEKL